jgi:membrane dipeptidase
VRRFAARVRIFDGHNDALSRIARSGRPDAATGFLDGDGDGHLDVPRATASGLAGGCFAVFTCPPAGDAYEDGSYFAPAPHAPAWREAMIQIGLLLRLEREGGGRIRVARTAADLDAGALVAVLHLEGAEPIGTRLEELELLHAAGMRSLGLTWSRPNDFATGVPFGFPGSPDQGPGLSSAGKALVAACNELRILVDVAHLNSHGFWDVHALQDGGPPLVASHAGAHALSASPRNLTDDQLRAIGESGGLVGINFHTGFLRADGADDPDTPQKLIVAHAAHVADVAGIDAVALGSDFDGATMPAALRDVAGLPGLLDAFRAAGFAEDELERVAGGNWRRVLEATWTA